MPLSDLLHLVLFWLPWALGAFYVGLWMIEAFRDAVRDLRAQEDDATFRHRGRP